MKIRNPRSEIRKLFILIFILCLVVPSWAGVGSSYGAQFLKLGGGARPLALGDAYTALGDDVSAINYNPAGLARVNYNEVMTMSNNWFVDMNQLMLGVAVPTGYGVWGIGYSGLASGDIQGYGATGEVTSTFNTASSAISVSFARVHDPKLSYGFGLKSVSERLESYSASTMAIDAGAQYQLSPDLALGASIMNLGGGLKFISAEAKLPTAYRLGAAYATKLFNEKINLAADLVSYADATDINLGVEYLIRELLALRVGSGAGSIRAGLGITANILAIDYSYRAHQDLGATHQLSLSLLFGAPEKTRKAIIEQIALGKAYAKENNYADAIIAFENVLRQDPGNKDADLELKRARSELDTQTLRRVFAEKEVEVKRTIDEVIASGKQFMGQGKYLEALGEFSNALKIDSSHSEALKLQSEAQYKMESQLIEQSKEEAKKSLGEAMKLVVLGKYKEALPQVEAALAKDPKNKEALALKKKLNLILEIEQ